MSNRVAIIALLLLIGLHSVGAHAQTHAQTHALRTAQIDSTEAHAFLAEIRRAISRFTDRNQAVAAGYRLIGPDFPGMGEHWVQPREAVRRSINARRPSVLSYVTVDGNPVLTGAAFALPIAEGESPPSLAFGNVWHIHEGTVEEETLILNPSVRLRGTESEYNLAMFHVWTEFENPDGVFSQDNWALPFFRLGLEIPEHITPPAGKAMFLMKGGDAYYARLLEVAAAPSEQEMTRFKEILGQYAAEVTRSVDSTGTAPEVSFLDDIWTRLWSDLEESASEQVWIEIRDLSR